MKPFTEGIEWSTLLVVSDLDRARRFYDRVLGATVERTYGDTSMVLSLGECWLLVVTGGGPTADKPGTVFAPPADPQRIDHEIVIKVPDCMAAYETLLKRGAEFLTPPVTSPYEIRAFFRDPDGHLFEISESRTVPASKAP